MYIGRYLYIIYYRSPRYPPIYIIEYEEDLYYVHIIGGYLGDL